MRCRRARPGLGTLVEIAFEPSPQFDANAVFDEAFDHIASLESQLSAHRADSALNQLCDHAHRQPQPARTAIQDVLTFALELHQKSDGIFDVTRPADDGAVSTMASAADIQLSTDGSIVFSRPLRVDLGGIAKGYVIDQVTELLQARGVESGCVNAGGDLRIFGNETEPVGLRFADGFRTIAHLHEGAFAASKPGLRPMSMADSGSESSSSTHYDGRNRQPVAALESVAVFAKQAMIADALTKVALVCPQTMDRLCAVYLAEWRRYPFTIDP